MVNTGPDCQHVFAGTREKKTKKKVVSQTLEFSSYPCSLTAVWPKGRRTISLLAFQGRHRECPTPVSTLPTPYLPSQRASLGLGDGAGERECYSLKNEGLI